MQSGEIKHWNSDKGYGFIDVDDQSEDVFFHISKARMPQPITVGQRVYFNSARNDKNQLRATEVTPASLSIQESGNTDTAKSTSYNANQNDSRQNNSNKNNASRKNTGRNTRNQRQNKKSPLSTLFSLIAIIAVAFYFFDDLQSTFFAGSAEPTTISQTYSDNSNPASNSAVTGDAQIDQTIMLIKQGGPFPYPNKDGTTFYNREGQLPTQSKGYYREYTVPTPGISHRGARRIVTGGNPPTVYYLTVDHYDSFRRLDVK
jgi:guanyl-specific ribonuclease Sa/cold shock CspA family protein